MNKQVWQTADKSKSICVFLDELMNEYFVFMEVHICFKNNKKHKVSLANFFCILFFYKGNTNLVHLVKHLFLPGKHITKYTLWINQQKLQNVWNKTILKAFIFRWYNNIYKSSLSNVFSFYSKTFFIASLKYSV